MQRMLNKDLTRFTQSLSHERQSRASKRKALLAGWKKEELYIQHERGTKKISDLHKPQSAPLLDALATKFLSLPAMLILAVSCMPHANQSNDLARNIPSMCGKHWPDSRRGIDAIPVGSLARYPSGNWLDSRRGIGSIFVRALAQFASGHWFDSRQGIGPIAVGPLS